ncbi:hypothetical protein [Marisediminicola sp. LYQ134]|uniref:hypothetical protein n=1 Tax=Marisediminicola sp. LYQ134 TaxID=3391061 RepID=UPI0039831D84
MVNAAPIREHVLTLTRSGLGYRRIADLAGISLHPLRALIWGKNPARAGDTQRTVRRDTAEKILAIQPDASHLADGALVPAQGTHRRVQALVARGWSMARIAAAADMHPGNLSRVMAYPTLRAATHRTFVGVYELLWNAEPPRSTPAELGAYRRSLRHASTNGWVPPLAWDDIDNDPHPNMVDHADELEQLDDIAIALACAGEPVTLTPAERRAALTLVHAQRLSDPEIAECLHLNVRTVLRIRQELNLPANVGLDRQLIERKTA